MQELIIHSYISIGSCSLLGKSCGLEIIIDKGCCYDLNPARMHKLEQIADVLQADSVKTCVNFLEKWFSITLAHRYLSLLVQLLFTFAVVII